MLISVWNDISFHIFLQNCKNTYFRMIQQKFYPGQNDVSYYVVVKLSRRQIYFKDPKGYVIWYIDGLIRISLRCHWGIPWLPVNSRSDFLRDIRTTFGSHSSTLFPIYQCSNCVSEDTDFVAWSNLEFAPSWKHFTWRLGQIYMWLILKNLVKIPQNLIFLPQNYCSVGHQVYH